MSFLLFLSPSNGSSMISNGGSKYFAALRNMRSECWYACKLARRIRRRIAADAAGIEGVHVELGKLGAGGARLGAGVSFLLVAKPDLAPLLRPMILVEVLQRIHHPLGVLARNILERIEPPGAAHELGLDLVERALARSGRFCRRGLQIHGRSLCNSSCAATLPGARAGEPNLSSATSHRPWRTRRSSTSPAHCRSGAQS